MIFCLFVLDLLGFEWSRVVRWGVGEIGCGIGLFCCGFWGKFGVGNS